MRPATVSLQAQRKARENAQFSRLFGLTLSEQEIILNFEQRFGYAYLVSESDEEWYYQTASFPFLYGLSNGLIQGYKDREFFNFAFFLLDDEDQPVAVIDSIFVPSELTPLIGKFEENGLTLHNLTVIQEIEVEPIDFNDY